MSSDRDPEIRIRNTEILADGFGTLRLTSFDYRRGSAEWETQKRESYDRGDSATILLYDRDRRTVLLTRQFRYPARANGHPTGMLLETAAGQVEPGEDPAKTIRREVEEELGLQIMTVEHLFGAFMSPGALTERIDFFAAPYDQSLQTGDGGGVDEGEDIDVVELPFDRALEMIREDQIVDAKTVALLFWAAAQGPFAPR